MRYKLIFSTSKEEPKRKSEPSTQNLVQISKLIIVHMCTRKHTHTYIHACNEGMQKVYCSYKVFCRKKSRLPINGKVGWKQRELGVLWWLHSGFGVRVPLCVCGGGFHSSNFSPVLKGKAFKLS